VVKSLKQVEEVCKESYERHLPEIHGSMKPFENLKSFLSLVTIGENEKIVLCTTFVEGGSKQGVFLLTDRRCVMIKPKLFGGEVISFPFDKIGRVEQKKTLMFALVRIYQNEKKHEFSHLKCEKVVQLIQQTMDAYKHPTPAPSLAKIEDTGTKIDHLYGLMQKGAINEEEFSLLKQQLIEKDENSLNEG
jgi:hypothetical protein